MEDAAADQGFTSSSWRAGGQEPQPKAFRAGGLPTPEASTSSSSLRQAYPSLSPKQRLHLPSGRSGRGLPSFLDQVGPWAGAASGSPRQFLPFKRNPEPPVLRWNDFFKWHQGSRDCLSTGWSPACRILVLMTSGTQHFPFLASQASELTFDLLQCGGWGLIVQGIHSLIYSTVIFVCLAPQEAP